MLGPRTLLGRVAAALLVAAVACTGSPPRAVDEPTGTPSTPGSPGASPGPSTPGVPVVDFRASDASGQGERGALRPAALAPAVDGVTATFDELFRIGFVDPNAWADGAYTSVFRLFERDVRPAAHDDLGELTLGRLWRSVEQVRPSIERFDARFLADAAGRPVVAVADLDFAATVRDGELRGEVAQTGRYVLRKLEGEWKIVGYDVRTRVPDELDAPATPSEAAFAPGVPSRRPTFVLVIGSDARPNQGIESQRADSLHVVGIDPESGITSVLGIPRDSWVAIPGHGTDKINAALSLGGADLVVDTVQRLTGVRVDAYILTGFEGFVRGVSEIGGIDVTIPYAISDHDAHARFQKGPAHLGGKQALAFSRARHDLPRGDFDRSLNQGRLLVGALATLRQAVRDGTAPYLRWAVAGATYLHTDLALEDLFELLVAAPSFDPRRARNRVASGRVATVAGKSVVLLDANAHAMFRDLARDGVIG